jgi:hypothetical protein
MPHPARSRTREGSNQSQFKGEDAVSYTAPQQFNSISTLGKKSLNVDEAYFTVRSIEHASVLSATG